MCRSIIPVTTFTGFRDAMEPARLTRRGGSGPQQAVPITESPFRIGRSPSNHLEIGSAEISRHHAEIVWSGDSFLIRDRESRAGTFVNGSEVNEQALSTGDRIRLGPKVELLFNLGAMTDDPSSSGSSSAIFDLQQTAALLEGLRAVGSTRVVDHVLELVLDSAIEITEAERGFIMLVSDTGELEFKTGRHRDNRSLSIAEFKTSRTIPEDVLRTGRTRVEADLRDATDQVNHDRTLAMGIRNVLCAPLTTVRMVETREAIRDERRIGVLYLDSRERKSFRSSAIRATLETLAREAAGAIENARLYREAQDRALLEHDLRTAHEFQQALLPTSAPDLGYFDAAARMEPCRMIGGDFFEYVEIPDGALGFTLGDVAGKGAPAGLLGARIQEVFGVHAPMLTSPAETIGRINAAFVRRSLESRYVTMFYGVLRPDGKLTYCNAGHNPPVLVSKSGVRRLATGGLIVGLFEDATFEEETIPLEPGDLLVVFSDGLSEAVDPEGHEFEDARIIDAVQDGDEHESRVVLERLFETIRTFTADAAQSDDMTALVLRYRG